ncbi:MAG: hypothetical protein HKL90_09940 [Elusimicrobia bacterium]|nr:hypothetical protein [Elusimicrobiota bacterium]
MKPKKISVAAKPRRAVPAVKTSLRMPTKPKLVAVVDYPQDGEAVRPGHYAVRVTATGAGQVQIRVDDAAWSDCRESIGHFWLDWSPVEGERRLQARARVGKGRWSLSAERAVRVAAGPSEGPKK